MTWQPNPHFIRVAHGCMDKGWPKGFIVSGDESSHKQRHIRQVLIPAIVGSGKSAAVIIEPIPPSMAQLLEEAPANWVFVIKTSDPQNIPANVRARCTHVEVVGKRRWVW